MQYAKNKKAAVSCMQELEREFVFSALSLSFFLWELFPVVDSSSLFRTTLATQQLLVGGREEQQQREYNF